MTAQRALLDLLGVRGLLAVVGPSYGGFQAFAWGIAFPDFMRGLVVAVSGLGPPSAADPGKLRRELGAQPGWNGGRYDESFAGPMAALRERTLRGYGIEAQLMERFPEATARDAEIRRLSRAWAEASDANSMLALGDAMARFKPTPVLHRIKARVLLPLSRTDALFPPSSAPAILAALRDVGVTSKLCGDRQRTRTFGIGHGCRQMGADAAGVFGSARLTSAVEQNLGQPHHGSE